LAVSAVAVQHGQTRSPSALRGASLLTPVQQLVAILVSVVTTILAGLNTFLAWQVYRRSKAQEILLKLQIAKLERELADLTPQEEKARTEAAKTSLILVS